jgi:WD40-like Beta Propeller Repeat
MTDGGLALDARTFGRRPQTFERSDAMNVRVTVVLTVVILGCATTAAFAATRDYGLWSQAVRVEATGADPAFNGPSLDGCPFIARDGKTFYMASNRPGGLGGIDIWVSTRASRDAPWGAPVNVGAPVNSAANDFCPTISRDGHLFYFVSNRAGGCGGDDIYVTRLRVQRWDEPENLGCAVNSTANEASPFPLPERASGLVLYFSSNRAGGYSAKPPGAASGDSDLYVSESHGGAFGPAELVAGANSAAEDGQPNLRRDGLELFFFSTRPGTLGLADLYSTTRPNASAPWASPVNLGPAVNSATGAETRPSLSWDGTTLYFGSTRPGGEGAADHYVTTR